MDEHAKFNAASRSRANAFYYVGKAEDTLSAALNDHVTPLSATPALARQSVNHSVTAILDPPRSGVHADVVRLLRRCPLIQRIVYVSCNPKSMMDNLQRFVQPPSKTYVGPPFTAVRAVPVDMFPHTDHCEMVVLLEREKVVAEGSKYKTVIKQFAHQIKQQGAGAAAAAAASASTEAPAAAAAAAAATPASAEPAAAAPAAAPTATATSV